MFTRILFSVALLVAATFATTTVHAQSASDIKSILDRMQVITSEMQKLQAEFQSLAAEVTAGGGTGAVLGAQTSASNAVPVFTESLEYGETNDDIARIQRLLATDPEIYDHPHITGFFGPKTEEAIMNLQERFGYDRVGVIGPATTELLEGWMRAYPDENYPDGVLSTKPTVLGASTSNTDSSGQLVSLQDRLAQLLAESESDEEPANIQTSDTINRIEVEFISDEAYVDVYYSDRRPDAIELETDDEDKVIEQITDELDVSTARVEELIDFERRDYGSGDEDEDDAEDAIDDADHAIDEADDEIEEADDDGDDVEWAEDTLEDAEDELKRAEEAFEKEDWDEAVEHAEESERLAEEAIDRIDEEDDGDSDEVDSIEVEVLGDDEAEVVVEYGDGNEEEFDVDEDRKEDIITEVADELDMDEDDVEDIIEFDYGDIDEIEVFFENNRTRVEVLYESGVEMRILLEEDLDEDEVIEEVARELDVDEDDVKDVIGF